MKEPGDTCGCTPGLRGTLNQVNEARTRGTGVAVAGQTLLKFRKTMGAQVRMVRCVSKSGPSLALVCPPARFKESQKLRQLG